MDSSSDNKSLWAKIGENLATAGQERYDVIKDNIMSNDLVQLGQYISDKMFTSDEDRKKQISDAKESSDTALVSGKVTDALADSLSSGTDSPVVTTPAVQLPVSSTSSIGLANSMMSALDSVKQQDAKALNASKQKQSSGSGEDLVKSIAKLIGGK